MTRVDIDQAWECPKCGTQAATAQPVTLHPPTCQMAHPPTEMEQVSVLRWGRQFEERVDG